MRLSAGAASSRMIGPRTMIPQSPISTLGMPASVSTMAPTGERSDFGARSARKRPIAIPIGAAISSASSEVIAVPQMKSRAPYWPETAFQVVSVRNPNPNCSIDGRAESTTFHAIRTTVESVRSVAAALAPSRTRSPICARHRPVPCSSSGFLSSRLVIRRGWWRIGDSWAEDSPRSRRGCRTTSPAWVASW
jgi:hypothetical protein